MTWSFSVICIAGSVAFGFSGFGYSVEIVGMVAPCSVCQEKDTDPDLE